MSWIKSKYIPFKCISENAAEIVEFIIAGFLTMTEPLLEELEQHDYSHSAADLFSFVSYISVLLLQELKHREVEHSIDKFFKMRLKESAKKHAEHMERCYQTIRTTRLGMITEMSIDVDESKNEEDRFVISWGDNFTLEKKCYSSMLIETTISMAHESRYKYIAHVESVLRTSLNHPILVGFLWNRYAIEQF
ncbi:hypothetical protein EB796_004430 [Bugula neritina]|uniref:Uncharacterized protein n=1 Tax=Bugula neritina TaxID=10212 RepID=A0A7J7KF13_BUGNE|nr:hypothetical protein EB796_004430 [Bugula neritina]